MYFVDIFGAVVLAFFIVATRRKLVIGVFWFCVSLIQPGSI